MKICRFDDHRVGLVRDGAVFDITAAAERAIATNPPGTVGDPLIAALPRLQSFNSALIAGARHALEHVRLLSPVQRPGKLVCAPVNYQAHIVEMQASNISPGHNIPEIGKAGLFLKATSALVGPSQGIALRFPQRRTDHELELVVVIGSEASEVPLSRALDHVAGYCVGLDITLRGAEDRSFRKSIDSYAVLGPWLTTADEVADPDALVLTLDRNGARVQTAETADLIYSVGKVIEFASSFYTLYPGDVIYTGTPQGVGPIQPGDLLRAGCAELGMMDVAVRVHEGKNAA
jgi:2,4-didehydro-3-deoxy-L-rhamnonate hydrolase